MLRRIARLSVLSIVALGSVAVVVGRGVGPTSAFKTIRASQRACVDGSLHVPMELGARVLNSATGEVTRLPAPPSEFLEWPCFSDWVDDKGEWSVVGRWVTKSDGLSGQQMVETGLARFSFPSGRRLEHIADCRIPARAPCWYPGPTPRVLYPGSDGRLYECTFGQARPLKVNLVTWPEWPAGCTDPYIESILWPKLAGLNGRILATVCWYKARAERTASRLWWLKLDRDGSTIEEAVPVSMDAPTPDETTAWRSPGLVRSPDGGLMIAWLRYVEPSPLAELLVAPLRECPPASLDEIVASEARVVARGMLAMPPVFSPDARWVYGVQADPGKGSTVRRFSVSREPAVPVPSS